MDGMGSPDGLRAGLGKPDMADFALRHQLGECGHRVLNRGVRVDPVLVVQIDVVRTKSPEGSLERRTDVGRRVVEETRTAPSVSPYCCEFVLRNCLLVTPIARQAGGFQNTRRN